MKALFLSLSVLLLLMPGQSLAQPPGTTDWIYLTNPSPRADTIHGVKIQPDGKVVAADNSYAGSYMVIAVGRYVAGEPDLSFGNNGLATTSLDSADVAAKAVELQPDGKIVVAGGYKKGTAGDFILVRYKPDGSLDSSFGVNGIVRTDIGSGLFDAAIALAIRPDGKIVAAGRSGSSLALCRYNPDGSLDNTFDLDGKLTVAAPGATCMMLQANGKIVVGCGGGVIRLNPGGSVDTGFGANGTAPLSGYAYGMAIQTDGKILLSGGDNRFVLERLDTAGAYDNSFGNGGVVTTTGFGTNTSNPGQEARWICLQTDGRIIAGGWTKYCILGNCKDFAIARYKSNGALDSSFGVNGKVDTHFSASEADVSLSAAISSNNELVVGGITFDLGGSSGWVLASYRLGPALGVSTVPGVGGQLTVAPNPAQDVARIQSPRVRNGTWHLSLCDLTGRTLRSETVAVTNNALDESISLTGLPAATYLVKLDDGVSRMTVRLVKSR